MLNDTGLSTDSTEMPPITDLCLDIELLHNSLSMIIQTISYPLTCPSIKSISLQFRDQYIMQEIKIYAETKIYPAPFNFYFKV